MTALRDKATALAEKCLLNLPSESGAQLLYVQRQILDGFLAVRREVVDTLTEAFAEDFADDYGEVRAEEAIKFIERTLRAEGK